MANRIESDKLQNVCKIGCGAETCAYITVAPGKGFTCAKADPYLEAQIRSRLQAGTMQAKGDNCSGNDD